MSALENNAGIVINAPVEVFALEEWRRLFEVNLFGHIAAIQTLLPALIRSMGRVVNISSMSGKIAMAIYGPYAGTKFALEAVSDALRQEVEPLGVTVVVVEPAEPNYYLSSHSCPTECSTASLPPPCVLTFPVAASHVQRINQSGHFYVNLQHF